MSRKTGCGLAMILAIVLMLAGDLAYVGGMGRLGGHPEAPPASPQRAPLDR